MTDLDIYEISISASLLTRTSLTTKKIISHKHNILISNLIFKSNGQVPPQETLSTELC
jgi:hypothetical protein